MKKRGVKSHKTKRQSKHVRPLGIRILTIYSAILMAFYLLAGLFFEEAIIFAIKVTGGYSAIVNITYATILGFITYALWNRERWGYEAGLIWYLYVSAEALISMLILEEYLLGFFSDLKLSFLMLILSMNAIAIYYLILRKEYFHSKEFHSYTKTDRFMVKVIGIILLVFCIVLLTGLAQSYSHFKSQVDSTVNELEGRSLREAMMVCNDKTGEQKDICFMVAAIGYSQEPVCNYIESKFYRDACKNA